MQEMDILNGSFGINCEVKRKGRSGWRHESLVWTVGQRDDLERFSFKIERQVRDQGCKRKACPCRLLIVKGFLGLRVIFLGTLFFFFFFFSFFPFREPRRYSASTATWPVTWRPLVKIGWLGSITLCPTYHHHFVCRSIDSRLSDLWVGGY